MSIPEIIKALDTCNDRFPMEAMLAAVEQREALTPELLSVLEMAANNPHEFAKRKNRKLRIFALFLLAQFREKRAFRPIIQMFSAPGETPFDLAGDIIAEELKRIIGSVYDGDAAPLRLLIEDAKVNEFVRCAAIDTFVVLAVTGQMPRDEAVNYYRSLFQGKLERADSFAWDGLGSAVAGLPAPELIGEVRQAFKDGLAEGGFADLEWIERNILIPDLRNREQYSIITNAIRELQGYACFHAEDFRAAAQSLLLPLIAQPPSHSNN